ncbi:MAG: TonB-dependent receptor, partial [Psychrosphaera sp.]|nr:TonB-dependent receptor [Psychrosphaera sp.]
MATSSWKATLRCLSICALFLNLPVALCQDISDANLLETITVTANRIEQNLQEVSSAISVFDQDSIEKSGIIDITGLEWGVPGLIIGQSGGEVRPAMRGARTNEVGVSGSGIAEQVVGIFLDGIYIPTTTAGLGVYVDIERIEVLRGPQGTLYGRNTFAGSINVITKQPEFDSITGSIKVLAGSYDQNSYEGIVNIPIGNRVATRLVITTDKHEGYISNHYLAGTSDDLRQNDSSYIRWATKWQPRDELTATLRVDYAKKEANSDAIWGYQQIAGYQLTETAQGTGIFNSMAAVIPGHIYQPADVENDDISPYDVFRNALSINQQENLSTTLIIQWLTDSVDYKWTTNYFKLSGKQFYDNDYSDGGIDEVGGFGRQDDQSTWSTELQATSNTEGAWSWVGGVFLYGQEADWEWLWREDSNDDGVADVIAVPSWGNPGHDPHKVDSLAVFGQLRYKFSDDFRLIYGGRYNQDDKSFTGDSTGDWNDTAFLWKLGVEYVPNKGVMLYASASTGYRTGGANDRRVVARGADSLYDNEDVISYEIGLKSDLLDGIMRFNLAAYANQYSDVKAQLFAVACNDTTADETVLQCISTGNFASFEYYENGGGVKSIGVEFDLQWLPIDDLLITASMAYSDAEFKEGFNLGNTKLRPLLGLGNFEGRQDVNDNNSQFSFSGWTPAMSPQYTVGLSASYEIYLAKESYLTAYIQMAYKDDYFAFDINITEVKVDAHVMADARLIWRVNENFSVTAYVKNIGNKAVLNRAVV